jgi:hypothetical protein
MMLTSRTRANAPLELQRNITLAAQPNPRPEDVKLKGVLTTLLSAAGLQAETPLGASYVMGYSMDESWEEVEVPVVAVPPREQVSVYPGQNGAPGRTVTTYEFQDPFNLQKTSRYLSIQGIRLILYAKGSPSADQPETVWEGYIELGAKVSSSQMTNALQQLLGKMGANFIGRVPLAR